MRSVVSLVSLALELEMHGSSQRDALSSSLSSAEPSRARAPGKQTLTMGLRPRPRSRPSDQGAADAAATTGSEGEIDSVNAIEDVNALDDMDAIDDEGAASPADVGAWLDAAVRPDLYADAAPIQRKASGGAAQAAAALSAPTSGGAALPAAVQAKMSKAFATDFSSVRVHEGPQAQAVGALAYTQGNDLFFAPGQYDPHSEKGQELIGHELAHTVQQAQGRVAAPAQAKGGGPAINADASLEREADEMGARAARGESAVGGAGASGALGALPSAIAQRKAVLQRKVGFEFETGWFVDRIPFDYDHDDVEQPMQKPVPFAKKDVISSAATKGFRLEADEAEDGRSELEIVVRPPIEESKAGLLELTQIMDDITVIGEGLKSHYNAKGEAFPLSDVTGAPFDYFTAVTPRAGDPSLTAGPQVTMGLDLSVIPKVNGHKAKIEVEDAPKFNGFLALVKQYLVNGTTAGGAVAYPKMIAEPLLARTDFVGLLALVEEPIKQKYALAKDQWVTDVLHHIGLPTELADVDLLARGVVADEHQIDHTELRAELENAEERLQFCARKLAAHSQLVDDATNAVVNYKEPSGMLEKLSSIGQPSKSDLQQKLNTLLEEKMELAEARQKAWVRAQKIREKKEALETHAGFTVGRWLRQLLEGVDLLPTIEDAESLGEFGRKTEKVGPQDKQTDGGIFEWRGDQKKKIPLDQWKGYALGKLADTIKINGG